MIYKHISLTHRRSGLLLLAAILGLVVAAVHPALSQTETVLFSFDGPDGDWPMAGVVKDGKGNLYGTTYVWRRVECWDGI